MVGSFGDRMRRRREEQGIALITVAEQTKIKLSLLEALERDDVRHWPSGFFGRAFVRAYAQAIGCDAEVVVREFLEAHPEPVEVVSAGPASASSADSGLRAMVGSAFGSLGRLRRSPAEAAAPLPPEPRTIAPATETPAPHDVDFAAVADLCTEFGRVVTTNDLQARLRDAAAIVDATGLILWVWDKTAAELKPALAHGYADEVLAQLPPVGRDADNATAAAFRTGEPCAIDRTDHSRAALAVPLLTPSGCAGVLAIELRHGGEHAKSARAAATIFAAVLAQLITGA